MMPGFKQSAGDRDSSDVLCLGCAILNSCARAPEVLMNNNLTKITCPETASDADAHKAPPPSKQAGVSAATQATAHSNIFNTCNSTASANFAAFAFFGSPLLPSCARLLEPEIPGKTAGKL